MTVTTSQNLLLQRKVGRFVRRTLQERSELKARSKAKLSAFIEAAWPILEPATLTFTAGTSTP